MASFIQPVRPIDTAPPWDWNPGQTFVTAFNQTRLTKAKSEQLQMEAELEQILLPYKQKQAALALDKMQLDVELQSTRLDREREFTKQAYRQEIDRVKGGGSNASANNQQPDKADDPLSFNISTTPSSYKLGGGLEPIKPGR
jgi:septal ring factor EnvC (AmiA/AmiB activator)